MGGLASKLCFKQLTYRTVMLLAFSSAKRLASLSLLIVKEGYLELGEQKVVLQPCCLECIQALALQVDLLKYWPLMLQEIFVLF